LALLNPWDKEKETREKSVDKTSKRKALNRPYGVNKERLKIKEQSTQKEAHVGGGQDSL
jgi:hypothetical protein